MRSMLIALMFSIGCTAVNPVVNLADYPTTADTDKAEQAVLHFYGLGISPALRVEFAPEVRWSFPGDPFTVDWQNLRLTVAPTVPISSGDLAAALWRWKLEEAASSSDVPEDPTQAQYAADANAMLVSIGL